MVVIVDIVAAVDGFVVVVIVVVLFGAVLLPSWISTSPPAS